MSKEKNNQSNKQKQINEQILDKSIKQLKQLIKSLRLSFPKEARRLQQISSALKNTIFNTYLSNQNIYPSRQQSLLSFNEYTDYKQLLCSESVQRFEQIYHQLDKLSLNLRKASSSAKIKKEILSINQFVKQSDQIKEAFNTIWKQQYLLILNYRMDIAAKDLQRWSNIALQNFNKQKTINVINKLFN